MLSVLTDDRLNMATVISTYRGDVLAEGVNSENRGLEPIRYRVRNTGDDQFNVESASNGCVWEKITTAE